jgi:thiol-disulfide isomerase/thioredoxin
MILLIGLFTVFGVVGCAQDRGVRTGPRSVASIGGKTEVIVSGEPGASISSTVPEYPGDRPRDSKISGRVVDDHGRAVADAKVRLAIAGAKGGRVESVKADSSGAFTLHRLKSGSTYILIAEAVDGDEPLAGRIEARAPQTSLKIRVHPKIDSSDHFRTSSSSDRARFGTVSDIVDQNEDEETFESARPITRINREDFDPPAPEAEFLDSHSKRSSESDFRNEAHDFSDDESSVPESRESSSSRRSKPGQIPASLHPDRGRRKPPTLMFEDDGENPLPPAIETRPPDESAKTALEESPYLRNSFASSRASSRFRDPQVTVASVSGADPVASNRSVSAGNAVRAIRNPPRPLAPELPKPAATSLFDVEAPPSHNTGASENPGSSRSATWGEITRNQEVPLDESLRKRSIGQGLKVQPSNPMPNSDRLTSESGRRPETETKARRAAPAEMTCRYDSATRRLHDFCLPDVQGRAVSLKDFESDLILLDFWGTWCAPCKTSIPQLVEFQNRFGRDRLQVIGIACERAAADKRGALVAKAQHDLAINYPLLIADKDGPCALREALQVQFYPTMILLDHKGQILWREQGATGTTLARLERAIQTSLKRK